MTSIHPRRRWLVTLLGAAALSTSAGCSVPSLVRQTTPAVVDSSLEKLDEARTKRRMRDLLASPEMKQIEKELITGLVDGSLNAMSEQRRAEKVGDIAARFTSVFVRNMSNEMAAALTNPENEQRLRGLVGSVVQASFDPVVKGISQVDLGPTLSEAMTRDLGPAMQKVLRDNLGPGIAGAMDSAEVRQALGGVAHAMGKEMILGANEALSTIQQDQRSKTAEPSLLGSVSLMADQGPSVLKISAIVVTVIAAALAIWVGRLLLERKRTRSEIEDRLARTRLMREAMRVAEGEPWRDDLLSALEKSFGDDDELEARVASQRYRNARASKPGAPRPAVRHDSIH